MSKAKQIEDFPDYYITDTGNVFSHRNKLGRFRKLIPAHISSGYLSVTLCKEGKQKMSFVHRLVANAFIPNPENKSCVNHKNGIKTNAKLSD